MGLDGVELLMATEEAFGIVIPDEAAPLLTTPAALIEFIVKHVPYSPSSECLTQQLFFRIRRGLREQLPPEKRRVGLDTPLHEIIKKDQWDKIWSAIRLSVGDSAWPERVLWPKVFGKGPKTIRQLLWHEVACLPRPNVDAGQTWTRQRIEGEVRRIVDEQLGIRDFKLTDRFAEDLGVD